MSWVADRSVSRYISDKQRSKRVPGQAEVKNKAGKGGEEEEEEKEVEK